MKKHTLLLMGIIVLFACNSNNSSSIKDQDSATVQNNEEIKIEDSKFYSYEGEPSFEVFLSFFHDTILPLNDHYIKTGSSFGDKFIPKEFLKFTNEDDVLLSPDVKFKIHSNLIGLIYSNHSNYYFNIYDEQSNIKSHFNLNDLSTIDGMSSFDIDKNYNFDISHSGMPVSWTWQYQNSKCAGYMSGHEQVYEETKYRIMPNGNIEDIRPGLAVVKEFLFFLSVGSHKKAYKLQQNTAWGSFEKFSSSKAFGGISSIEIDSLKFVSGNKNSATVKCIALYKDTINGDAQITQNFYLSKTDNVWVISKMKVLDFKKTAQYTNDDFKYCDFRLSDITTESFNFYLFVVSEKECDYGNKAGKISGTAYFLTNSNNSAVFDNENCVLEFVFDNKKLTISEIECYDYKNSGISFEGIYSQK